MKFSRLVAILAFLIPVYACANERPLCEDLNFENGHPASDDRNMIVGLIIDELEFHAEEYLEIAEGVKCTATVSLIQSGMSPDQYAIAAKLVHADGSVQLDLPRNASLKSTNRDLYTHQILEELFSKADISSKRPVYSKWSLEDMKSFQCDWETKLDSKAVTDFVAALTVMNRAPIVYENITSLRKYPSHCGGGYCALLFKNGHPVYIYNDRDFADAMSKYGSDIYTKRSIELNIQKQGFYEVTSDFVRNERSSNFVGASIGTNFKLVESRVPIRHQTALRKVVISTEKVALLKDGMELGALTRANISFKDAMRGDQSIASCPGRGVNIVSFFSS